MLERLQNLYFANQSSRPLIITEDVLEPFTCVILLSWLMQDVHHFPVATFTELFYLSELWRHDEVLVET